MVTLWTIQYEEAYRVFETKGVLRANNEHLFCGDDLRFAYSLSNVLDCYDWVEVAESAFSSVDCQRMA